MKALPKLLVSNCQTNREGGTDGRTYIHTDGRTDGRPAGRTYGRTDIWVGLLGLNVLQRASTNVTQVSVGTVFISLATFIASILGIHSAPCVGRTPAV